MSGYGGFLAPAGLAHLLRMPEPTPEQARVISADAAPHVVVAGAGSGKSETVAARVVWLVANGMVRPERVLGLTFTRKAAGELAERVRLRLAALHEAGAAPVSVLEGEPTVSTYHAYAARLVADHALREAREPTLRLISPAVQWQLAARVVSAYDGPMDGVPWTPDTVIAAVLELAGELGEHLRVTDDVRGEGDRLRREVQARTGKLPGAIKRLLDHQHTREQLLPLVEGYQEEKAAREVIDYSDQVALAAQIAQRHPDVGAMERARYGIVLLDEYQDTGHAQLVLLRSLFGAGHPVMAVGDPCQSIYGWRGAAAGNLVRFPRDFPTAEGTAARQSMLSVSFRNGERVLRVAAGLSERLRRHADIPELRPGTARMGRGAVRCALLESARAEAAWIATEVRTLLDLPAGTPPDPPPGASADAAPTPVRPADVAVLARKRSQFPALRQALEERGVAVEVVGLGGLLTVPEVADVVATLRVLRDSAAGDALARLLTGPRWRIGPADLVALGQRARELARMDHRDLRDQGPEGGATSDAPDTPDASGAPDIADVSGVPDPADAPDDPVEQAIVDMTTAAEASLVDALDDLGPSGRFSSTGYARLSALGAELRQLRLQVDQPLPDLVTDVERALGLDIEVSARPGADPVTARADLDAFVDAAARFAGDEDEPTLGAFLAYLSAAEDQEFGLEAGRVSEANSVKLMTVHAAKGLEWPVVAVPGLSAGRQARIFPAKPRTSTMWTDNPRKLPFSLRGDRADLPKLDDVDKDAYDRFADECAGRVELEERRLAYVAMTRASSVLLCSGYWWGEAKSPLGPSVFLREVRDTCDAGAGEVAVWAPPPTDDADNPALASAETVRWPVDPREARSDALVEGVAMVEAALTDPEKVYALSSPEQEHADGWALDARLLLAERQRMAEASAKGDQEVELPESFSVTTLVSLARERLKSQGADGPEGAERLQDSQHLHGQGELARQIRRPMPRPPAPRARRGTAFHGWLESRYGQLRLLGPDDLPGAADETAESGRDAARADRDLAELRDAFLGSAWAALTPLDIEVPFQTVIGDRLIRGRMDAVFAADDGVYDVVDWKTGARPRGQEAEATAVQLAAYRLAWAELADVSLESVRASFHYVRTNETVRPVDLLDADGLANLVLNLHQRE